MAAADRGSEKGSSTIELRDGTRCRIRPSGPFDRKRLLECFRSMSPESRRLRFFAAKQALTAAELDLYTHPDGRSHIALAALRLDESGRERETLGFARCLREPGDSEADLSIAVADASQRWGVGRALLSRLVEEARAQGVGRLRCEVLAENRGMRGLLSQLAGKPIGFADGILTFEYPLSETDTHQADWGSFWLADAEAWVSACTRAWLLQVDQAVTLQCAANDRLGLWLLEGCPLSDSQESEAA